ncbi:hypothetical protein B566_EDAN002364 [Ephemera danica]|nr:hypothetical protein B566_EDAN002364 [Ephemera danica]
MKKCRMMVYESGWVSGVGKESRKIEEASASFDSSSGLSEAHCGYRANRYHYQLLSPQIFMHKSAMQMHAREAVQAAGGGPGGPGGVPGARPEVKPHQCQQCLKSFSSNHQLVQHIRVHTGEKPYKCSYCDRRFKQLSHVQQHTRLHTAVWAADAVVFEVGRSPSRRLPNFTSNGATPPFSLPIQSKKPKGGSGVEDGACFLQSVFVGAAEKERDDKREEGVKREV